MSTLKAALKSGAHFTIVTQQFVDFVVGRDDQSVVLKINLAPLCLTGARVTIRPDLKIMSETSTPSIEVIEDDGPLSCIAVEPLVLRLNIGIWETFSSRTGLACAWGTIVPVASDIRVFIWRLHGLEDIESALDLRDLVETDKSFIHGSLESHLLNLLVPLTTFLLGRL